MPHTEVPLDERRGSNSSSVSSLRPYNYGLRLDRTSSASSTVSSIRSDQDFEEDDQFPAEPVYIPIVLPTEPTLDELLKRVTGRNDLQNVEEVKLRVISNMVSLSRISIFMPKLKSLNLEGSVLFSLRDLGCHLTYLKYLNVSNCGLTSLDGTIGLTTVETLIADDNLVEIVSPLGNLTHLKVLSLKNNRIRDLGLLTFLDLCSNLREVNLQGNPVTANPLYRHELKKSVASLEILDEMSFDSEQQQSCSNEAESINNSISNNSLEEKNLNSSATDLSASSLSEEYRSGYESDGALNPRHPRGTVAPAVRKRYANRPTSSQSVCQVIIQQNQLLSQQNLRSYSADNSSLSGNLNLKGPICGSIIGMVRQQRKYQVKRAWRYSSSSSSGTSASDSIDYNNLYEKTFPNQLPQNVIDLELGVVGVPNENIEKTTNQPGNSRNDGGTSTGNNEEQPTSGLGPISLSSSDTESNGSLKDLVRRWRIECQRRKNSNV